MMRRFFHLLMHWLRFHCGMTLVNHEGEPKVIIRCHICMEKWIKPEVLEVLKTRGEI